jgi:uncharacterized protein (DUF1800 family)
MAPTARTPLAKLDPARAWRPWKPDARQPWDLKWAGHLYRRAAFGATWDELQRARREGPEKTIARLLAGAPGQDEFDQLMDELAPATLPEMENTGGLQGWWLYRMIKTFHPLRERMTLFWHGHFATSIVKVQEPALMRQQNILMRKHALGKFGPFLLAMSKDPAMLIWLDSNSNVRGQPNENYAREVMELFSLGTGHYTERDVREAARCFTGWHTSPARPFPGHGQPLPRFVFNRLQHDGGVKTLLGRTANWDGGDVVRILLEQPACALFLVRKLYRAFISEGAAPPDSLLEPLAEQLRNSDYDIGAPVGTMLRSRHFFSEYAYRQRIKAPAEFIVFMLRSLEVELEGMTVPLPAPLDGLGQTLFAPPNVKGWDGGRAWLNSATMLARHNLAWKLLQGRRGPLGARVNPAALVLTRHTAAKPKDYARQLDFLLDLLLQPGDTEVSGKAREALMAFLAEGAPVSIALDQRLREVAHAIMVMPEYQLA